MIQPRATIRTAASLVTVLVMAGVGYADTMTYNGLTQSRSVTIHEASLPGGQGTLNAGQFSVTYKGVDYWSYCVDIGQAASTMDATEQPIATLPNVELVGYLFETFGPQATNTGAAALQVAIWEAVYETAPTFDASAGAFFMDPGLTIIAQANAWINSFPGSYTPSAVRLANPVYQDMLIIPEPTTMGLLAIGVAALTQRRKRMPMR